jgi:hypothetical protein
MDDDRLMRAKQVVEENRERLNQNEEEYNVILAGYDKYRWLKIIGGMVFVLVMLGTLILFFQFV